LKAAIKAGDEAAIANLVKNTHDFGNIGYICVNNLKEENSLADIAKNAKEGSVRKYAKEMLADITKDTSTVVSEESECCLLSVEEMDELSEDDVREVSDQAVLAEIAQRAECDNIRLAAVRGLTVQAALAEIAQKDYSNEVRYTAAQKLADQALAQEIYADIAKSGGSYSVAAARLLTIDEKLRQDIYANIAMDYAGNIWVRVAAAEALTDKVLAKKALTEMLPSQRGSMMGDKIQYMLREIGG